ncbi:hypothetical protein ACHAQD_009229 [Fusarium lateritium]
MMVPEEDPAFFYLPCEYAFKARIFSYSINHNTATVDIWIDWRKIEHCLRRASKLFENVIRKNKEDMLCAYWATLDGRDGLIRDTIYHLCEIIKDQGSKYLVQRIGYDDSEAISQVQANV